MPMIRKVGHFSFIISDNKVSTCLPSNIQIPDVSDLTDSIIWIEVIFSRGNYMYDNNLLRSCSS